MKSAYFFLGIAGPSIAWMYLPAWIVWFTMGYIAYRLICSISYDLIGGRVSDYFRWKAYKKNLWNNMY